MLSVSTGVHPPGHRTRHKKNTEDPQNVGTWGGDKRQHLPVRRRRRRSESNTTRDRVHHGELLVILDGELGLITDKLDGNRRRQVLPIHFLISS